MSVIPGPIALWALTPNGAGLADRLAESRPSAALHLSTRVAAPYPQAQPFDKLGPAVAKHFSAYRAHLFFMATGIVVRSIAPLLEHKTQDPAVVVVDDQARWAVSLISGHLGGANRLAEAVAEHLGARAVITTASDVNHKPAIDLLARERNLVIVNPEAIRSVNMALLTGAPLGCHDPFELVSPRLPQAEAVSITGAAAAPDFGHPPGIFVDDRRMDLPVHVLVLCPPTLVAGIGCRRGTPKAELFALLEKALDKHHLARASLCAIATADLKADEAGLVELAADLGVPLECHSRAALAQITNAPSPSAVVQERIGVPSVCEAAALTSAPQGALIVPKMKTSNATVAIARKHLARRDCTSSASAPETWPTSR
ncbi:MAG: cobalt-precorrin 5A hydrolase [Desulfosarcinaceae bacterium]|jgi:cobalt-precorrin 5A hydrolase